MTAYLLYLVKSSSHTGYSFENPFFCRWAQGETMGDLGPAVGN